MPELERRALPLEDVICHASGKEGGGIILRGHAAVFDRLSLDLGGFREKIARGAFTKVLDGNPDVHLVWDHDGRATLARTTGRYLLELREDPRGLHFYANAAPTSYAKDLAMLMDGGTINQGSFAFTVGPEGQDWATDEETGEVTRTITEVEALYDVTITGQGAYPATDTTVVQRSLEAFRAAHTQIPSTTDQEDQIVEPDEAGETESPEQEGSEQDRDVTADEPGTEPSLDDEGEEERVTQELQAIRAKIHERMVVAVELAKRRLPKADRK